MAKILFQVTIISAQVLVIFLLAILPAQFMAQITVPSQTTTYPSPNYVCPYPCRPPPIPTTNCPPPPPPPSLLLPPPPPASIYCPPPPGGNVPSLYSPPFWNFAPPPPNPILPYFPWYYKHPPPPPDYSLARSPNNEITMATVSCMVAVALFNFWL